MSTFAGVTPHGAREPLAGKIAEVRFYCPRAIAIDPTNPNRFFAADFSTIRVIDTSTGTVKLLAGDINCGYDDGVGADASFQAITSFSVSRTGKMLLACSATGNSVRIVDVASGWVRTVYCNTAVARPLFAEFDVSPHVGPDSVLYIATDPFLRDDVKASVRSPLSLNLIETFESTGSDSRMYVSSLVALTSGYLLFSMRANARNGVLLVADPRTGRVERIAEAGNMHRAGIMCAVEEERSVVFCATSQKMIQRLFLPRDFFGMAPTHVRAQAWA